MDYVQLIARASNEANKEPAAKLWYPEVEPLMASFQIKDKAKLVNYVLHAKHSKIHRKVDKLDKFIGEDFDEIVSNAKPFIVWSIKV